MLGILNTQKVFLTVENITQTCELFYMTKGNTFESRPFQKSQVIAMIALDLAN